MASSFNEFDHIFKFLLIGDSGVGKSRGACLGFYSEYRVDFKTKRITVNSGGSNKTIKITVWDTAGQERFRSLASSYYRGVHGIVMVFDVSREDSFLGLTTWMREVEEYCPRKEVVRVLVGNKVDKGGGRLVSADRAKSWAAEWGMLYLEASARTNTGVTAVFSHLVQQVLDSPNLLSRTRPSMASAFVVDSDADRKPAKQHGKCSC